MRSSAIAAFFALLLALAASGGSPPDPRPPATLSAPARQTAHLLGIVQTERAATLVRVNPTTIRALPKPRLSLRKHAPAWSLSPDRSALAVVTYRETFSEEGEAAVRLISVRRMAVLGDVKVGTGYVQAISWPAPGRLLLAATSCCPASIALTVVDTAARRVISRAEVPGRVLHAERTADELILLLAPPDGIGQVRLSVFDATGEARLTPLAGVSGGWGGSGDESNPVGRQQVPALAVDPATARAFVIDPQGTAVQIDLRSMAITRHRLSGARSVLGRLHDWLEPEASAKAIDGPSRSAVWLGNGLIAVTGQNSSASRDRTGAVQISVRPAGLTIVDTATWSSRRMAADVDSVHPADGGLLVTGVGVDSSPERRSAIGISLYTADGRKRFQALRGKSVSVAQVLGRRALVYVESDPDLRMVDLSSGRLLEKRWRQVPWLLLGGASRLY